MFAKGQFDVQFTSLDIEDGQHFYQFEYSLQADNHDED